MGQPPLFQRLWTARWVRLFLMVIVGTGLFYQLFQFHSYQGTVRADLNGKVQNANHLVHDKVENANFSGIANRMSAIAQVAEVMTNNSRLSRKPLMEMLENQFPWWVQTKPIYTPWDHKGFNNKGASIIMSVGSHNAQLAASLILSLRNVLGSKIPIELAYAGNQDLPLRTRETLRSLAPDVYLIDMLEVFEDESIGLSRGGYAMKPFALLASRYPKTILVDADTVFFESPDRLFDEHPGLLKTGTLFYHDRTLGGDGSRSNWVKEILTSAKREPSERLSQSLFYNGQSAEEADSGMVCVDKTRPSVFMALMFTAWMNTKVRDEITYHRVYGDKETYWLAPELMGVDYYFQPWYAGQLGVTATHVPGEEGKPNKLKLCSRQMLHMDASGKLPFWANGGLYYDKAEPTRGFASWTHWWIGRPGKMGSWGWENDPYNSQWGCLTETAGDVHRMSPEMTRKVELMIFEYEKIEGLVTR